MAFPASWCGAAASDRKLTSFEFIDALLKTLGDKRVSVPGL